MKLFFLKQTNQQILNYVSISLIKQNFTEGEKCENVHVLSVTGLEEVLLYKQVLN